MSFSKSAIACCIVLAFAFLGPDVIWSMRSHTKNLTEIRGGDNARLAETKLTTKSITGKYDASGSHASKVKRDASWSFTSKVATILSAGNQETKSAPSTLEAHEASAAAGFGGPVAAALVGFIFIAAFGVLLWRTKPSGGDFNACVGLLMDNIGALLAASGGMCCVLMMPFGNPEQLKPTNIPDVVFGRVIPGMVPTMLFGCAYYAWMAVRTLRQSPEGATVCALPYGINTPAAFCFVFGIIMPVASQLAQEPGVDPNVVVEKAWEAGVAANLLAGLISVVFAAFGPFIVKLVPSAALMIALAGVGFTWLGLHQVMICFSFASVGLVCMVLGIMLLIGVVRVEPLPPALVIIVVGTAMGWMSGHDWEGGGSTAALKEAASRMGTAYFPGVLTIGSLKAIPSVLSENLGVVLPVAFSGSVGTLLNVKSAENAGDAYPLREAMLFDGLTTCVSALFGSPFGTCIYLGHKEYKKMGGYIAYQLMNGLIFCACAMLGSFGVVNAIVLPYAIAPINLFIGLMIAADSFSAPPARHIPACLVGLFPAVADFVVKSQWAPEHKEADYWGLVSLSHGSLLLCVLWCAIFVFFLDGKFFPAACMSTVAAAFSAIGLLHQGDLDLTFQKFTSSSFPYPDSVVGTRPVSFVFGYGLLAVGFGVLAILQFCGLVREEFQEEVDHEKEHEDAEKEASRLSFRVAANRLRAINRLGSMKNHLHNSEPST